VLQSSHDCDARGVNQTTIMVDNVDVGSESKAFETRDDAQ
jgi:hypothetical protein